MVNRKELTEDQGNRLKPKNCHAPRLTGVPKVHKNGVPMRGILSMVGSPFEKISKALILILRTVQGRSGIYIKNSRELNEKIKNWRVKRNEILVSYDVKNLYPAISIDKALQSVEKLLNENEDLGETTTMSVTSIMELLKWMFDLTYCEYGGSHFVLDSGPIGLGAWVKLQSYTWKTSN